jgi:dipeptidyl aminopeptidase/acylaminoacyl peptidase
MGSQQGSARFSPDGKRIVFDSDVHGSFELFIMPADGGPPQRLTTHAGNNYAPAWSPDGNSVYFSTGRFGRSDVMRVSVADRQEVRITASGANRPQLSGDGNTLVFQRGGALWALSLSSGAESRIAPDTAERAYATVGDEIYYARAAAGDFTHSLEVYNLKTRTVRRLGSLPAPMVGGMDVAPDRKRILFTHGSYTGSFQFGHRFGSDLMLIEGLQP